MSEQPTYLKDLDEIEGYEFERTKQAPLNLESVRMLDLVHRREGTVVRLIPVQPKSQNIKISWKVEYVPDRGMFDSFWAYMKLFFGQSITEVTPDQFPDRAIDPDFTNDHEYPGSPRREVLIMESEEHGSPVADQINTINAEGIKSASESAEEAWSENRAQKAQNLANEGGKRAASDKESPSKRSRSRDRDRDKKGGRRKRRNRN